MRPPVGASSAPAHGPEPGLDRARLVGGEAPDARDAVPLGPGAILRESRNVRLPAGHHQGPARVDRNAELRRLLGEETVPFHAEPGPERARVGQTLPSGPHRCCGSIAPAPVPGAARRERRRPPPEHTPARWRGPRPPPRRPRRPGPSRTLTGAGHLNRSDAGSDNPLDGLPVSRIPNRPVVPTRGSGARENLAGGVRARRPRTRRPRRGRDPFRAALRGAFDGCESSRRAEARTCRRRSSPARGSGGRSQGTVGGGGRPARAREVPRAEGAVRDARRDPGRAPLRAVVLRRLRRGSATPASTRTPAASTRSMYRGRVWSMRMFSGFGTPEDTNRRFHYLLSHGESGLSIAFDDPTLYGIDADDPESLGEVGKCGVNVSSLGRHGPAPRRDPARRRHDEHDDQRPREHRLGDVHPLRRAGRASPATASGGRRRTTS